jgi:hypothetical protein
MTYIIILGIITLVIFLLVLPIIRSEGFYEVYASEGNRLYMGKYNDCVNMIKSQKEMDKLIGTKKSYFIKKWNSIK